VVRVGRFLGPLTLGGAAGVTGLTAWVMADRMLARPADVLAEDEPLDTDRAAITAVGDGEITLSGGDVARPGRWGLKWEGGYGQVGRVLSEGTGQARREFRPLIDAPSPGADAVLDADAYPDDPDVLGLDVEEVTYRSPVGELPAWLFPAGDSSTWAVLVHGRAGRRGQMLRLVPVLHGLGITALVISYRNDPDAPDSPDGHCHLGATEWEDVEGAAVYALGRGATELILVGNSMGGTASLAFLRTSPHASRVRAAVLDAPVVRWPRVLRESAARRGAPATLASAAVPLALGIARIRARIDWSAIDHLGHAGDLRHPVLLLHGDADAHVPLETSRALAERRPDLVSLRIVRGATHLASWNLDPGGTEAAVRRFLLSAGRRAGRGRRTRAFVQRGLRRVRSGRD
jgi:uncharacterized protein